MSRSSPTSSSRYHHGDLRRALLVAAAELAAEGGPEALSLRAVARRAGVSANAPYNHFDDKASLLAAVAREAVDALTAALQGAAAEHSRSPASRLEAIGVAYVTFATTEPSRFRLLSLPGMGQKTKHPELVAAYQRSFEVLVESIRHCQEHGVVRGGDVRRMALAAWSAVHGLACLHVEDQLEAAGFDTDAAYATTVVRALFRGLRA